MVQKLKSSKVGEINKTRRELCRER
jgi:hypothetical protein